MNLRPSYPGWRPCLLWSGVLLLAVGFVAERSWQSLPLPRVLETLLLGLAAEAIAFLLQRLLRISLASALLCVFAGVLAWFVGVVPLFAMLVLAAGGFCLCRSIAKDVSHEAIMAVAGIGVLAGLLGWLLPFPVHYRFVYLLPLLLLCISGRRHLSAALRGGTLAWRAAVTASPAIAAFAVLVVGLASAGCWLPTAQFDDLAYHLGCPRNWMHWATTGWMCSPRSGHWHHGPATSSRPLCKCSLVSKRVVRSMHSGWSLQQH